MNKLSWLKCKYKRAMTIMCAITLIGVTATITLLLTSTTLTQAVVVERNYYSYYKLPARFFPGQQHRSNRTEEFLILQCPYRRSTDIPKPKDMQVCTIVGYFKWPPAMPAWQKKSKPKSKLHTKVNYRLKLVRPVRANVPIFQCAGELKVLPRRKERPREYNTQVNTPYHTSPSRQMSPTSTTAVEQIEYHEQEKAAPPDVNIQNAENNTEIDVTDHTPLRYLSVKNIIEQLFRKKTPAVAAHNADASAEQFFAENLDYQKGNKLKGYQNVYHRDEIFNDHIFYDDLDEGGQYKLRYRNASDA